MNENVPDQPDFDFTGGNGDSPFDPFSNYAQFIVLSQAFEDTGAGMDQTTKYDIDVEANSDVNAVEITESFDEALGMTAVLDIADPFIPGDQGRSS